jgi:hypothetical protein
MQQPEKGSHRIAKDYYKDTHRFQDERLDNRGERVRPALPLPVIDFLGASVRSIMQRIAGPMQ